jgi:mono/diheme cytochrome c family protein
MNTISAISYQVINGKNGMPAFGGLTEKEIEDVATYVLQKKPEKFSRIIKNCYLSTIIDILG